MAKQLINLGTTVNDGTGDALRVGAEKINENFTELYNFLGNSSGQLSLVSSIAAEDGLSVSSPSGNILIRANIASTTDLGSIRVGTGLQISEGGVLSVIPQAVFDGDYNSLANKPDLSVYQLAANAFNGSYNSLVNKPAIPTSLFNLGIAPGTPGEVLVLNNSNVPEFQQLFDQNLNTNSDVLFNSLTTEQGIALNTSTAFTEQTIQSLTAQKNNLEYSTLPGLQNQLQSTQQNLYTWQGILSAAYPGSPEYYNAMNMVQMFTSQVYSIQSQIGSVQGQISTLTSRIGYLGSTLAKTSTTLVFDHYTMSLVTDVGLTVTNISLPNSNSISVNTGISINSNDTLRLNVDSTSWLFNADGTITLPSAGDILDAEGNSIIPAMPDQSLNTTSNVEFNSILTNEILSTGTSIPSIVSATNLKLGAAGVVELDKTPLRLGSISREERNARTLINGDIYYNSSKSRVQLIENNVIQTLRTTQISDWSSDIVHDIATCGVSDVNSWSQEDEDGYNFTFFGYSSFRTSVYDDVVYFSYDPTKFTGGILEFEAHDVVVDTDGLGNTTSTIYNRYYGTVKFGHFNDGTQDHFVFEPSVTDALGDSNYNFGASIKRGTIPSTKGGIDGVGLSVRQLVDVRGQLGITWRAKMFAAKAHQAIIYVVGIVL